MRNVEKGIMLVKRDRTNIKKYFEKRGAKNDFEMSENRRGPSYEAQNPLFSPQSDSPRSSTSSGEGMG